MTDPGMGPDTQAEAVERQTGRWGVFDQHRREWVVPATLFYERDAWTALLAVESPWPWELAVREDKRPAEPSKYAVCPECMGEGVCESCDRDCTRCDGAAEIPVGELADHERRRLIRRGYLDDPAKPAQAAA